MVASLGHLLIQKLFTQHFSYSTGEKEASRSSTSSAIDRGVELITVMWGEDTG